MNWKLLRAVSRSFYITIRVLPPVVREPIALGYLLARASDSIADTSGAEVERRVEALQQLRHGDIAQHALSALVARQENPAEAELLRRLPELLDALEDSRAQERLGSVWNHILHGQLFDLVRFPESADPRSAAEPRSEAEPLNAEELEEYTFLVAGSVGEFWTRLCADLLPDFSRRPVEELVALGVAYGKGLQLVNILRDRRADAAIGRVYLPEADFADVKRRARVGLESGLQWAAAVDNGRVRFAGLPPARIGLETLARIEIDSGPVKVSRGDVRRVLLLALPALWGR